MLFVATEIKPARCGGMGCFATEAIAKNAIVGILVYRGRLVSEDAYLETLRAGSEAAQCTGTRWVGSYFTVEDQRDEFVISNPHEAFINHSYEPTLLFHCGICFATRALAAGSELTVNYEYVLSEGDPHAFRDIDTGRLVRGLSWQEALYRSAAELLHLQTSR